MMDELTNYIKYRTLCPLLESDALEEVDVGAEELQINSLEDLQGLKDLENITTLDLSNQGIEDISPLRNCPNLKILILRRNKIKDISVLAQLQSLEEIDLSYNQIEDFSPLKSLPNLTKVAPKKLNAYLSGSSDVAADNLGVEKILVDHSQTEMTKSANVSTEAVSAAKGGKTRTAWYADLKNPRIQKSGFIFKKMSVTWDCVSFGSYPQTKVVPLKKQIKEKLVPQDNGDYTYTEDDIFDKFRKAGRNYFKYQPIRWRILNIKNGIATLFANVVLDVMPYQNVIPKEGKTTWENCSLKEWLMGNDADSFWKLAFSEKEREAITGIGLLGRDALNQIEYAGYGMYDLCVKGKLSIEPQYTYAYSEYAEARNLSVEYSTYSQKRVTGKGAWWLETLAYDKNKAMTVNEFGRIVSYGVSVTAKSVGVRPVITVDLGKLEERLLISTVTA